MVTSLTVYDKSAMYSPFSTGVAHASVLVCGNAAAAAEVAHQRLACTVSVKAGHASALFSEFLHMIFSVLVAMKPTHEISIKEASLSERVASAGSQAARI
eukprot:4547034-Pleurochrysis_carterae.AAC.3